MEERGDDERRTDTVPLTTAAHCTADLLVHALRTRWYYCPHACRLEPQCLEH